MKTIKYFTLRLMAVAAIAIAFALPAKAQVTPFTYFNVDWQFNAPISNNFANKASGWGMNFEGGYYVLPDLSIGAFINYHTYQIYVRPMSLTRTLQWQKEEKSSLVHAQDLSKIEQTGLSKQAKGVLLAPSADKLKAIVWIDGEEVPVLMKQEIKEYFDATEYGNAYLLTVDMPRHQKNILPYRIFKVELTDLENGDRGEGLYYMEKENYIK